MKESWEALDVDIITRSFKKTGISNELDGTEDDALWRSDDDDDDDELEFPGVYLICDVFSMRTRRG